MTIKRITAMMLGALLTVNVAGGIVCGTAATAEAAAYHSGRSVSGLFERALRQEHERHEKKVREIRAKYSHRSQRSKMEHELSKEHKRHEQKKREIERSYRSRGSYDKGISRRR